MTASSDLESQAWGKYVKFLGNNWDDFEGLGQEGLTPVH